MASGHVNRTNRPNTWLHRPACGREESPCQPGAVHTWHFASNEPCAQDVRNLGISGLSSDAANDLQNETFRHQSARSPRAASGVQLRRRRANRFSVVSASKFVAVSTSSDRSTSSNVFTLNTAYRIPSIMHVTIGIAPHLRQT